MSTQSQTIGDRARRASLKLYTLAQLVECADWCALGEEAGNDDAFGEGLALFLEEIGDDLMPIFASTPAKIHSFDPGEFARAEAAQELVGAKKGR